MPAEPGRATPGGGGKCAFAAALKPIGALAIIAVICAAPAPASADGARPVLAVFDIQAKGVHFTPAVLDRLGDYLTGQIGASGQFQVVPRGDIKSRISTEKKESYQACYDQSCQIEIGKELAAEKSLAAELIKLGSKCTVVLAVIDLKRAASEFGASAEGSCTEDGVLASLKAAVASLSQKAAAIQSTKPAPDAADEKPKAAPNRCEIALPEEGCPGRPEYKGTFEDSLDPASAGDEARCAHRASDYYYWCGTANAVVSRFFVGGKLKKEERMSAPSRCEITLPEDGCPGSPSTNRVFNDNHESSASNPERCLQRAADHVYWCGTLGTVIARYYEGGKLKQELKSKFETACQITLGPEGCPGSPAFNHIFHDNAENAGSNEPRCLRRAGEYHAWCGSSSAVVARYFAAGKPTKEERFDPPSRCEVRLPEEGCPGSPGFNHIFNDNHENAGSDEARCTRRALDFYYWCGNANPVTARYFQGSKLIREEHAHSATRCQITLPAETCPGWPYVNRIFNDDFEGSGSNVDRCMKRSLDWFNWCGDSGSATARYYSGASLVRQQEGKTDTRCQITLPEDGCPAHPGGSRIFNDDFEHSSTDKARCLKRADEWLSYCTAHGAVTARYYQGQGLAGERKVK